MGRGQLFVDELDEEMAAVIDAEQSRKDTERVVGDLLGNDSPRRQLVRLIDSGEGAIIHDMLNYSIIRVDSGQARLNGHNRKRIDSSHAPCHM